MKIIKIVLCIVAAYFTVVAAVLALCRFLEHLMTRDYATLSGIGYGSGNQEAAGSRIKIYKKVLAPAYFVKDALRADQIASAVETVVDSVKEARE